MSQPNGQRRGETPAYWRRPIGLLEFIVLAVVLGLVAYLIQTYLPLPPPIKLIIVVAIVLVLVLILVRSLIGDVPLRLR